MLSPKLSGGMLQRVMIGLALLFGPKLLIADERPRRSTPSPASNDEGNPPRVTGVRLCHALRLPRSGGPFFGGGHGLVMHRGEIVEKGDLRKVFLSRRASQPGISWKPARPWCGASAPRVGSVETAVAAASF
jgi:hypothetical protein